MVHLQRGFGFEKQCTELSFLPVSTEDNSVGCLEVPYVCRLHFHRDTYTCNQGEGWGLLAGVNQFVVQLVRSYRNITKENIS